MSNHLHLHEHERSIKNEAYPKITKGAEKND